MAVRHGYGKIAGTDALVFAYDTGDTRNSYRGEPTVNLVTNPDFATGNYSGWSSTGVGGAVEITGVFSENGYNYFHKKVNKVTAGALDRITQSSVYTIDTSLQTTVTFDIWINPLNAYYITFYGLGSTADDTTYDEKPLTSNGTTVKTVSLGEGWTRYIYTLSTAWYTGTGNTFRVAVYPDYGGTGLLEYKLRRVQVEQKSHATPFVNGTRSATQGLLDLTGNSSIDLSNVSFDSNAQMTFDGSNDTVTAVFTGFNSAYYSLEWIINPDTNTNYNQAMGLGNSTLVEWGTFLVHSSSTGGLYCGTDVATRFAPANLPAIYSNGQYVHCTFTFNNGSTAFYKNGALVASKSMNLSAQSTFDRIFMSTNLDGYLPVAKVYNRALTAAEVRNNYNQYKGRFNI